MVDLFRAGMRSCGALRIDHVMALLRLVGAAGEVGRQGCIYYPVNDLLGILASSLIANCLLIGGSGDRAGGIDVTLKEQQRPPTGVLLRALQKDDGGFISRRTTPSRRCQP